MAQSHIVMAFRKRLRSKGYTDISIVSRPDIDSAFPSYLVTATDPVFQVAHSKIITEMSMSKIFTGKIK